MVARKKIGDVKRVFLGFVVALEDFLYFPRQELERELLLLLLFGYCCYFQRQLEQVQVQVQVVVVVEER